jgi:hypothetical protein
MRDNSITDHYLPPEHLGAVEALLIRLDSSLAAPIYSADEIEETASLRFCASPVDFCIRNLTARFPDGPTYFVVTRSGAVNALIARFPAFQCILVAEGVYVRAAVMLASLFTSASLRAYVRRGIEPDEPRSEPIWSREEALLRLAEDSGAIDDEVRGMTVTLGFLLMYVLTAHEIGHLALGHLDLRPGTSLDETGPSEGPKAESRAQEWDADGFALNAALYLTGSPFRNEPGWRDYLTDNAAALRILSVLAYVLFTLMDSMGPQDRPAEDRTHPRPLVRIGLASLTLTAVMHHFGAYEGETVMDTMQASIRAVEIALQEIAGGVMEPELAFALGKELEAEAARLIPVLGKDLWPRLDRSRLSDLFFARGLMIPPALEP